MGFWRHIFRDRSPIISRDQWDQLATAISNVMEVVRVFWFMECKLVVASLNKNAVKQNLDLSGDTLLLVKSYQLYNLINFAIEKSYISELDGNHFARILHIKALGDKAPDCNIYFSSFKEYAEKQAFVVATDICKFTTGSADFAYVSAIVPTLNQLVAETNMFVAKYFGDSKTSEKIAERLGPRRFFK